MPTIRRPICFVSMPIGVKKSAYDGIDYDFDAIYEEGIRPAIHDAGAEAVRADLEITGGLIHKPLFERIIRADVLVADLTTANANVFYELGIRHAARRGATITIMSSSGHVPFDVALLRTIVYGSQGGRLSTESATKFRSDLVDSIKRGLSKDAPIDSPLFALLDQFPGIELGAPPMSAEVFMSYAREDQENVLKAYSQLKEHGFRPWIDQKDITPGEKWELAIDTALRRADFILVFLSEASVGKRGYLRREIHDALGQSREMLDTDIFLVPVRLDDCEVPRELKDFQWVDFFREDGISRLVEALRTGLQRR